MLLFDFKLYLELADLKMLHQTSLMSSFSAIKYSHGFGWCNESSPILSNPWCLHAWRITFLLPSISDSNSKYLGSYKQNNIDGNILCLTVRQLYCYKGVVYGMLMKSVFLTNVSRLAICSPWNLTACSKWLPCNSASNFVTSFL